MQKNILKKLPQKFKSAFCKFTAFAILAEGILLFPNNALSQGKPGQESKLFKIKPSAHSIFAKETHGFLSEGNYQPSYSFALPAHLGEKTPISPISRQAFSTGTIFSMQLPYLQSISGDLYFRQNPSRVLMEEANKLNADINPGKIMLGNLTLVLTPIIDCSINDSRFFRGAGLQALFYLDFDYSKIYFSYLPYQPNIMNSILEHRLWLKVNF
ncbi:hypothetical protein COU37_04590 [Candidatus Micrarchaeota archaeon CG10_big_fil_rev_8_21_14_0_10_45_29]|nr:MAG: hypothetical protein COU37_04590 [Candidatus Micrarchaeota archaeon CG10_big_fil_rev_8_21_14_0_10_45_29]